MAVIWTDTTVSGCEDDGDATRAEMCEQERHEIRIFYQKEIFNAALRDEDCLWDDRLIDDVSEPGEVQVLRERLPTADSVEDVPSGTPCPERIAFLCSA